MKLKRKTYSPFEIILCNCARLVTYLLVIVQISSCKKYLDKKSDNAFVVPATLEDAQGLLDDVTFMSLITPSLGEASTTDYFQLPLDYNNLGSNIQYYTWIPFEDNYSYPNDWSNNYRAVYNSNLCLQAVEKINITTQNELQWKNVKGSALFFRAYCFLNLCWNHTKTYDATTAVSDLGIALKLVPDFNQPTKRASVKESYERIISDAKESILYLPDEPFHVLRPSKAAAYGLLARAFLSMRIYDSALKYSDLCLRIKHQLMNYNNSGGDVIGIYADIPFKRFNAETIFYTEMGAISYGLAAYLNSKTDTLLYASYDTSDLRRISFFKQQNGYPKFKGSYAQSTGFLFTGITTAEMFLTRAECYARGANTNAALADLDTLLKNRWSSGMFMTSTAANAQEALSKILVERRKELLFRGLRWMDIKRLNKESATAIVMTRSVNGQTYSLQPNANYYALPIPYDIIKLTGIPQNPQ